MGRGGSLGTRAEWKHRASQKMAFEVSWAITAGHGADGCEKAFRRHQQMALGAVDRPPLRASVFLLQNGHP